MKRTLALFLIIACAVSLFGCTPKEPAELPKLEAGFGRADLTPDFSVGLGGYSNPESRRSEGVADNIYATCIAFREDGKTILLYTVDNCGMSQTQITSTRVFISTATGISTKDIYIGATHTHSAPSLNSGDEAGKKYLALFYSAMVDAGKLAIEDLSPVTVSTNTTRVENMTFVRHYRLEDGSYAGSNFGDFEASPIADHAAEADDRMVLIKFDRVDRKKKDILLMNWQGHPDQANELGFLRISASYIGPLRSKMEARTNMHFAFFTGADGNQNIDSKIRSERHNKNWRAYGRTMASHALKALRNMTPVQGDGIRTVQVQFAAETDHSWDKMLPQATEVYSLWKAEGIQACDELCKRYDFTSVYQARAIISRSKMSKTANLELNAFTVGGVGFVVGTYEMCSDAGIYIRANSPFETTFFCTGNSGYIPSAAAYDYRSYESDTGMYAKGTAEKLAEKYVEMLNNIR